MFVRKLHTVFFAIQFAVIMVVILVFLIIFLLFRVVNLYQVAHRIMLAAAWIWSKSNLWFSGSNLEVEGKEHIPAEGAYCLVSNHQGGFDILALLSALNNVPVFVAKKELRSVPVLGQWMQAADCIFIDRRNRAAAVQNIKEHIETMPHNRPIMIYPEGTRSRSLKMNPFKRKGLQIIIDVGIPLVPVTMVGTYKVLEEKKAIQPSDVKIIFHPLIEVSQLNDNQKSTLIKDLQTLIAQPLQQLNPEET